MRTKICYLKAFSHFLNIFKLKIAYSVSKQICIKEGDETQHLISPFVLITITDPLSLPNTFFA